MNEKAKYFFCPVHNIVTKGSYHTAEITSLPVAFGGEKFETENRYAYNRRARCRVDQYCSGA